MLRATQLSGFGGGDEPSKFLWDILVDLGLDGDCIVCLDAADTRSYDGSSQTWSDITTNGFDFYRGHTSGSNGGDPTFNGTAGVPDEGTYFSFDGGDFFTNVTNDAPDIDALGWVKNNGLYSIIGLWYLPGFSALSYFWSPLSTASVHIRGTAAEKFEHMHVFNNSASQDIDTMSGAWTVNTWNFLAASAEESTTSLLLKRNTTDENFTFTASTLTAGFTSQNIIGARSHAAGIALDPVPSGTRIQCFALFDQKFLTATELNSIYQRLKLRSPSLP